MWGFSLDSLGSVCAPEVDSERTCVGNSYGKMGDGVRGARAQASNLGLAGPRLDAPASLAVKLGSYDCDLVNRTWAEARGMSTFRPKEPHPVWFSTLSWIDQQIAGCPGEDPKDPQR